MASATNGAPVSSSKRPTTQTHHKIPTIALALYPGILLLGSLYASISPTANPAANISSSANTASTDPNDGTKPINYFARKSNVFNVYFVKIGWLWTTAAFLALLWAYPAFNSRRINANTRLRRIWQAFFRYTLITVSWILTTQWCFGPAIIDRGFIASGGKCNRPVSHSTTLLSEIDSVLTSVACKTAGGSWSGGHDVSGHAFMLVVASAFLAFELAGSLWPANDNSQEVKDKDEGSRSPALDQETGDTNNGAAVWTRNFVLAVIGLSLWMLLMTGIWFHTFLEKVSGSTFLFCTLLS